MSKRCLDKLSPHRGDNSIFSSVPTEYAIPNSRKSVRSVSSVFHPFAYSKLIRNSYPVSGSPQHNPEVFSDIRQLIEETRKSVAVAVNARLTLLYWEVGNRINDEVLNHQRAEYGKQIIAELSTQIDPRIWPGMEQETATALSAFCIDIP